MDAIPSVVLDLLPAIVWVVGLFLVWNILKGLVKLIWTLVNRWRDSRHVKFYFLADANGKVMPENYLPESAPQCHLAAVERRRLHVRHGRAQKPRKDGRSFPVRLGKHWYNASWGRVVLGSRSIGERNDLRVTLEDESFIVFGVRPEEGNARGR